MHFKDRWLLPIYLVGRKIQPGLIGKTKRRSSSRFRAELVSGGTCSSENCPRSVFPQRAGMLLGSLCSVPALMSAGIGVGAAKSSWKRGSKQVSKLEWRWKQPQCPSADA